MVLEGRVRVADKVVSAACHVEAVFSEDLAYAALEILGVVGVAVEPISLELLRSEGHAGKECERRANETGSRSAAGPGLT